MTFILTHRGLNPIRNNFYPESSLAAFKNHLVRGYGIEFDITFTNTVYCKNIKHKPAVSHGTSNPISLSLLLKEINKYPYCLCALHFKGKYQTKENIISVISELKQYPWVKNNIIIFDLKPEFAEFIKSIEPALQLAPSVAHEYDIKRYNSCVDGTLISLSFALENKKYYDWVWLDEWDLTNENNDNDNNKKKIFYTATNFNILRKAGYKIALVTPELHSIRPNVKNGNAHPDSVDFDKLIKRIMRIVKLRPDAICSNYHECVKNIINIDLSKDRKTVINENLMFHDENFIFHQL